MKINDKILSIPPYISTSWKLISSLHMEPSDFGPILIVSLVNGTKIQIPNLEQPILEAIFGIHARWVEQETSTRPLQKIFNQEEIPLFGLPLKFGSLPTGEVFEPMIGHNPEQADAPDLPREMLNKISSIAKTVAGENINSLPKAEPHCNCPYCQIAKAIHENIQSDTDSAQNDESSIEISDEDLKFSDWFIQQIAEKVYSVTNPFNQQEQYNVYLGEPIGCTCGQKDCPHIKAVLRT